MFVNLILRILLYFAGLTGLLVMCLKGSTAFRRGRLGAGRLGAAV